MKSKNIMAMSLIVAALTLSCGLMLESCSNSKSKQDDDEFMTVKVGVDFLPDETTITVIEIPNIDMNGDTLHNIEGIIDNTCKTLRARLENTGLKPFEINKTNNPRQIEIKTHNTSDIDRLNFLLLNQGKLEFYETFPDKEISAKDLKKMLLELSDAYYCKSDPDSKTLLDMISHKIESCLVGRAFPEDTAAVNRIINSDIAKNILPKNLKLCWSAKAFKEYRTNEEKFELLALKTKDGKPVLNGDVITEASSFFDDVRKQYIVNMTMNKEGGKMWAKITEDNTGSPIAIVLDDQVYSYPNVNDQISDGRSQITGNFTPEEANDFATILKIGHLEIKPIIISQKTLKTSLPHFKYVLKPKYAIDYIRKKYSKK